MPYKIAWCTRNPIKVGLYNPTASQRSQIKQTIDGPSVVMPEMSDNTLFELA